MSVTKF